MAIKVFISYSWDSEEHKEWVKGLADSLLAEGIEAVLDQYDVSPGDRLPHFMEQSISECDYVLVVCTPSYKAKADGRDGGVGYESNIITGELYEKHNDLKYIPVLRSGDYVSSLPTWMAGKYAVDLRGDNLKYDDGFQDLLTTVRGENRKPPVANKRKAIQGEKGGVPNKREAQVEPLRITGIITDEVTLPKNDGTRGSALYKVPFRLSGYPSPLWTRLFIECWDSPSFSTFMHRPDIASVIGDKVILDGTTIEEVQQYHRDTLIACVEKANQQMQELLEKRRREEDKQRRFQEEHSKKVTEIASQIEF